MHHLKQDLSKKCIFPCILSLILPTNHITSFTALAFGRAFFGRASTFFKSTQHQTSIASTNTTPLYTSRPGSDAIVRNLPSNPLLQQIFKQLPDGGKVANSADSNSLFHLHPATPSRTLLQHTSRSYKAPGSHLAHQNVTRSLGQHLLASPECHTCTLGLDLDSGHQVPPGSDARTAKLRLHIDRRPWWSHATTFTQSPLTPELFGPVAPHRARYPAQHIQPSAVAGPEILEQLARAGEDVAGQQTHATDMDGRFGPTETGFGQK